MHIEYTLHSHPKYRFKVGRATAAHATPALTSRGPRPLIVLLSVCVRVFAFCFCVVLVVLG